MTLINDLKTYKIRGQNVKFSQTYYNNVMDLKKLVDNNFDAVEVDDGMEGSGKSELAKQKALILNENFSEDDIVYTTEQFEEWVEKAKPGSVCLWDEFVLAGLSTEALTKMQTTLIKYFAIMRSKRLIVILVVPYIFMLRKYFAVARTRYLSHTYTKGLERGFVKVYNYNSKHYLYNYGQKTWLYNPKIVPSFHVKFENWSHKFLDEAKIEAKKQEALKSIGDDKDKKQEIINFFCKWLVTYHNGEARQLINQYPFPISERTIRSNAAKCEVQLS